MAELDKNKEELKKQGSSVFKSVPQSWNNNVQKPRDRSKPEHKPDNLTKPASTDRQVPKSSLISKLNQPYDSSVGADQNQAANVFPKPISTKQSQQSSMINKLTRPNEPVKHPVPVIQSESVSFSETTGSNLWQRIGDKLFEPKPGVSPTRQKAMVIMVPILAIIMIFVLRQVLSKAPSQTEGAGIDDVPIVSKADTGNEIDWKIPEPIKIVTDDSVKSQNENETQNTEQNETATQADSDLIIVKDIVFSKDKPSAFIGSKIVYVGDVINNATVVKINRNSVEFEKDGYRWEQNVREEKKIPVSGNTNESEGRSEPKE
jgi:hypothetical protein